MNKILHTVFCIVVCCFVLFFSGARSLSVTEIFFDGTDEWIELSTTKHETYSGVVYLSGAKTSLVPLAVSLNTGDSIVFADHGAMFLEQITFSSGYGRSFADTQSLVRDLIDGSGFVLDRVFVDADVVSHANNHKASLVYVDGERLMSDNSYGLVSGYYGSPTIHGTGGHTDAGGTSTLDGSVRSDCITGSLWNITEVFRGSDAMSPFVELRINQIVENPHFTIAGDMIPSKEIAISGHRYPGDYIILTWGSVGIFPDDIDVNMSPKDTIGTGFLEISGQSGQVFDRVFVSDIVSHAQNFVGHRCGRVLDSQNMATPGYSKNIIAYMNPVTTKKEECIEGNAIESLVTLDGVWPNPGPGESEKIAITVHNHATQDLTKYYILKNNASKRYLYGPSNGSGSLLIEGNFALSNTQSTCVDLYNDDDMQIDRLCYDPQNNQGEVRIGAGKNPYTANRSQTGDLHIGSSDVVFSGTVTIESLLYDPPGSDINKEKITLHNLSNTIFYDGELRLLIGEKKVKKYIHQEVGSGLYTVNGSFAFPNTKATCVELHYKGGLLDTYCYKKQNQTTNEVFDIHIDSVIYDPQGSDTGKESITFSLGKTDHEVDMSLYRLMIGKMRKKLAGILTQSTPLTITKTRGFPNKKPACVTLLYGERPIDYYCRGPQKTKTQTKISKIKTTPSERIYRDYINSLHQYMRRNRSNIYYKTDFQQHVKLYKKILSSHKKQEKYIEIYNKKYPIKTAIETLWTAQKQDSYYDIFIDTIVHPLEK